MATHALTKLELQPYVQECIGHYCDDAEPLNPIKIKDCLADIYEVIARAEEVVDILFDLHLAGELTMHIYKESIYFSVPDNAPSHKCFR